MEKALLKHMILIPGLLRCIDNNLITFLDSAHNTSQLFIVTELTFKSEATFLTNKYGAKAWFVEDLSSEFPQDPPSKYPGQYAQWLKFHYALTKALEWEKANNICFECIHKIRTDVSFSGSFNELMELGLSSHKSTSPCMLSVHDFCFSARRDLIPKLSSFLQFLHDYLHDSDKSEKIFSCVNSSQLKETDLNSAPYLGAFPTALLVGNKDSENSDLFYQPEDLTTLPKHSYIDAVSGFASWLAKSSHKTKVMELIKAKSPRVRNNLFHYYYHKVDYIYPRFLNLNGIITYRYSSPIKLKQVRHAVTNFSHLIFQLLDEGNVSFLSNRSIDWSEVISEFLEKGGQPAKFTRMFYVLLFEHQATLTTAQFSALETIYSCLLDNAPGVEPIFDKKFRDLAKSKGIELPMPHDLNV